MLFPPAGPGRRGYCSQFFFLVTCSEMIIKSQWPNQKSRVRRHMFLFYTSPFRMSGSFITMHCCSLSISELGSWSKGWKYRSFFPPLAWYCTLQLQLASICSPSSQQRVTTLTHSKMVLPGRRPSHHPNHEQLGMTYVARTSVAKRIFKFESVLYYWTIFSAYGSFFLCTSIPHYFIHSFIHIC